MLASDNRIIRQFLSGQLEGPDRMDEMAQEDVDVDATGDEDDDYAGLTRLMASAFVAKPQSVVRETGNMFAIALEALRRHALGEGVVAGVPRASAGSSPRSARSRLCSSPSRSAWSSPCTSGSFNRQLGAESATGAAMVLAIVRESAPLAMRAAHRRRRRLGDDRRPRQPQDP